MKQALCPKSPSHRYFRRLIEVKGPSHELLDEQLNVIHVEEPAELRLVKRFSETVCAQCGTRAKIWFPF